jgi:hypothetical protein
MTVTPQDNVQSLPLYIRRICSLKLPVTFSSTCTQTKETALIDSGATENFIDYHTAIKWRLEKRQLDVPRPIFNVDGTSNKAGSMTDYCVLRICMGNQEVLQRFYITNLGEDRLILGYPWL